jgi:predicted nucleic acid-binding protein
MIVVSDTSPLNDLILIDAVDPLPQIFGQVYAPPTVVEELKHVGSPEAVRLWADSPPTWFVVREPSSVAHDPRLDPGETAAIALAEELQANALLIDEKDGRKAARQRGLHVVGTLGVLTRAAQLERIDLPQAIVRLKTTNFHVKQEVVQEILQQDQVRKLAQ